MRERDADKQGQAASRLGWECEYSASFLPTSWCACVCDWRMTKSGDTVFLNVFMEVRVERTQTLWCA